jgi:23S rRNA (guanosine2251-2'-O)-methyltransferase
MASKPNRAGAVRKSGKGATVGTGGHGRRALEGKGPTPKAEDREWHPAAKAKARREKLASLGKLNRNTADATRKPAPRRTKPADDSEIVTGRNSVLEALRARIPATALYIATRIEMDDRVKEVLSLATNRGIPILEVMRPELDRMAGFDSVHQGLALKVPPYNYAHPEDLLGEVISSGRLPLFVALDGITDPRNLGAIIRSTAAFGGNGVILPQRRSVGLTASAWKTSAGAAARCPVAMAANLTATIKSFKEQGVFVVGLDGGGDIDLPQLELADRPLLIVVGSEGKGLSRLVTENCDAIVSIPISASTESLNAGIAASVALYEVSRRRSGTI